MVAPCFASFATASSSETLVRFSARVTMIVCVTPGRVSCAPRAAADARNEVTPGIISEDIFFQANPSVL